MTGVSWKPLGDLSVMENYEGAPFKIDVCLSLCWRIWCYDCLWIFKTVLYVKHASKFTSLVSKSRGMGAHIYIRCVCILFRVNQQRCVCLCVLSFFLSGILISPVTHRGLTHQGSFCCGVCVCATY